LRLPLILTAIAFFTAAYGSMIEDAEYGFGIFYLLVGCCNLLLLRYIEQQTLLSNAILNGLNMIAAFVVSVQFYFAGSVRLPYAYLFIGFLYLFVTARFVLKYMRFKKSQS
jgi:hypothetical protein